MNDDDDRTHCTASHNSCLIIDRYYKLSINYNYIYYNNTQSPVAMQCNKRQQKNNRWRYTYNTWDESFIQHFFVVDALHEQYELAFNSDKVNTKGNVPRSTQATSVCYACTLCACKNAAPVMKVKHIWALYYLLTTTSTTTTKKSH